MNLNMEDAIKGQQIERIDCLEVDQHEHTGKWIYTYFFHLSSDETLRLEPASFSLVDDIDLIVLDLKESFPIQVIDGSPDLIGETIETIIRHPIEQGEFEDEVNVYGLLLSSGRVAANFLQGGGGSILHVESLSGIFRHNPGTWIDNWSGIELA